MDYFGFTKVPVPEIALDKNTVTYAAIKQIESKNYLVLYRFDQSLQVILCLIDYPSTGDANTCNKMAPISLPTVETVGSTFYAIEKGIEYCSNMLKTIFEFRDNTTNEYMFTVALSHTNFKIVEVTKDT